MHPAMPSNAYARLTLRVDTEVPVIERLQAFGLIEPDGRGGWRMTRACEAGLAALSDELDPMPEPFSSAHAVRPWQPRRL